MSDKKVGFLNNIITITITILTPPGNEKINVVHPPGKGKIGENCCCLKEKSKRSFKQVILKSPENEGKCLFYATELAREYTETHGSVEEDNEQITSQQLAIDESTSKSVALTTCETKHTPGIKTIKDTKRKKFTRKYKNHEKKMCKSVKFLMKKTIEGLGKQVVEEGFGPYFANNVHFT